MQGKSTVQLQHDHKVEEGTTQCQVLYDQEQWVIIDLTFVVLNFKKRKLQQREIKQNTTGKHKRDILWFMARKYHKKRSNSSKSDNQV